MNQQSTLKKEDLGESSLQRQGTIVRGLVLGASSLKSDGAWGSKYSIYS